MDYMNPFDDAPDMSRRRFLRYGANAAKNAAAVGGTMLAAKAADDLFNPVSLTSFGKLPEDTKQSLKLLAGVAALSPADKELHTKIAKKTKGVIKSPAQVIYSMLANEPATRREALKTIGATAALAPAGLSPVARTNNMIQNATEMVRNPLDMKPLRDAAILSQWDKIGKAVEQDISRRNLMKGILTLMGGRALAKL
jgi:hypothetical protein